MKTIISKEKYQWLGKVPIGIGAIMKGWNIKESDFIDKNQLPVIDFRAMTHNCPHNCFHCFTDKNKKTLTLKEIKSVIDQLARLKTKAIDYLGEGEPTIDPDFLEIIKYTVKKKIQPIVFTDAATMLFDKKLVKELNKLKVTIVPKMDSLYNEKYQNFVVGDKTNTYFKKRNQAIELLMKEGFNRIEKDGSTRLGFDMVICKKNKKDIPRILRWCRQNNIFIVFANYLPAGRSGRSDFNNILALSKKELAIIKKQIIKIDKDEFNYDHTNLNINNFHTIGCMEYIQIYGDGRISPCSGCEVIIGNTRKDKIKDIVKLINTNYPRLAVNTRNGNCPFREVRK
jgi:MoaA/NifB/PqqE/SkfB family radical SAM enzyme